MYWWYVLISPTIRPESSRRGRRADEKTIKCLLIYPNPESALDEEAGKQLLADYDGYCKVSLGPCLVYSTASQTERRDSDPDRKKRL